MGSSPEKAMTLRTATAADRERLVAIDSYAAEYPSRGAEIDEWLATAEVVVAERDGLMVGYAAVNHAFLGQPYLAIVMVAADARRQGIGRALVTSCGERHLRLWTSTNESNLAMQRLFAGAGFRLAGRVEGLDQGDPELFYHWDQTRASR
jgi:ribosomal protein S18 acetylase RimI-like enzyme